MLSANLYLAWIRYFPLALMLAKNRLETGHLEEKKTELAPNSCLIHKQHSSSQAWNLQRTSAAVIQTQDGIITTERMILDLCLGSAWRVQYARGAGPCE